MRRPAVRRGLDPAFSKLGESHLRWKLGSEKTTRDEEDVRVEVLAKLEIDG